MLSEIRKVRQISGDPKRRWFNDEKMDLVLWLDDAGEFSGFQLSYNKPYAEKAVTWSCLRGFSHQGIDNGESRPGKYKGTPILVPDGTLDSWSLCGEFRSRAKNLDGVIVDFVSRRLVEYEGNLKT